MALRISGRGSGGSVGKKVGKLPAKASTVRRDLTQGRVPNAPASQVRNDLTQGRIGNGNSGNRGTSSRSSYSGSPSGPGGGFGTMSSEMPSAPVIPTEEDYLKGDATYNATISALAKQLQSFQTDIDAQRSSRKLDYDKAIKDLGYVGPGQWNFDDSLTASGRSYQNLVNDNAARGTLQSSGYADNLNDLTRSLMDQYTGINDSNTQFNTDLDRQTTKAKDENTAASQAARAEAIMRRAAQYGFGV